MLRRIAVASALLSLAAPAVRAQNLAEICRTVMHPPVGSWSRFRLEGGRENGATVKMSIVGSESRGDSTFLWMETEARGFPMGPQRGGEGGSDTMTVISKMLVSGLGVGAMAPHAIVFKLGSMPAMSMPMQAPSGRSPGNEALRNCGEGKIVGWESVTVPAGTFRALHVQDTNRNGNTWLVPDLPFALVKIETSRGEETSNMVLVAHGTGARSAITETPQPFDPAAFAQMMMQQRQNH